MPRDGAPRLRRAGPRSIAAGRPARARPPRSASRRSAARRLGERPRRLRRSPRARRCRWSSMRLLDAGGGADIRRSAPGLAALTADLLDEGTSARSGPQIAEELERSAAALASGADWNSSAISARAPGARLRRRPRRCSPRSRSSRPSRRTSSSASAAAGSAELLRRRDQPAALADEAFAAAALRRGIPTATRSPATRRRSRAIDARRDRRLLHRARYRAAAPTLAGRRRLRRRTASRGGSPELRARADARADGAAACRRRRLDRAAAAARGHRRRPPGAAQTELRIGHLGVPRRHPDRVALGMLNTLLGGKFTSRHQPQPARAPRLHLRRLERFVDRRGPGPFLVWAAVTTDARPRAPGEILGEIERHPRPSRSRAELDEAMSYLRGVFPYGLQSPAACSAASRSWRCSSCPDDHFDRYLAELETVERRRASQRVAREHLHPEDATSWSRSGRRRSWSPRSSDSDRWRWRRRCPRGLGVDACYSFSLTKSDGGTLPNAGREPRQDPQRGRRRPQRHRQDHSGQRPALRRRRHHRLHRVEDGNTVTDFDPEEIERKISIDLRSASRPGSSTRSTCSTAPATASSSPRPGPACAPPTPR